MFCKDKGGFLPFLQSKNHECTMCATSASTKACTSSWCLATSAETWEWACGRGEYVAPRLWGGVCITTEDLITHMWSSSCVFSRRIKKVKLGKIGQFVYSMGAGFHSKYSTGWNTHTASRCYTSSASNDIAVEGMKLNRPSREDRHVLPGCWCSKEKDNLQV
jgi:hypothetical protein